MEDPGADDNVAADKAADGDTEDRNAAMDGLWQMSQRLQFDILESFLMILLATLSEEGKTMMR